MSFKSLCSRGAPEEEVTAELYPYLYHGFFLYPDPCTLAYLEPDGGLAGLHRII